MMRGKLKDGIPEPSMDDAKPKKTPCGPLPIITPNLRLARIIGYMLSLIIINGIKPYHIN
jgi:hypothetical protein